MRADCIHRAIPRIVPPWLSDLAGAWIFYTVLPAWPWPQPSFQRIARFAPWMGLLIGALQGLLWIGLSRLSWPPAACALCVVALGIQLSGGLHHDGLIDTADGLGAPAERRLEAMEDSRVGASGVLALVMVLLLQVAALIQLGGMPRSGSAWLRSGPGWHRFGPWHVSTTSALMEPQRFIASTAGLSGMPCPHFWWWFSWPVGWGPCPFSWGAWWQSLSPRALGDDWGAHR